MTSLAPRNAAVADIENATCLVPFDPQLLAFVQALSDALMKSPQAKSHPELVALGFWLRASHIEKMRKAKPNGVVKALGLVVHFTPANVDTMFVYSWVCSLLMGNRNVIRVASQASELRECLLGILNSLFCEPEFQVVSERNLFVHYDKNSEHSASLSLLADARVIWGGDESVQAIRALTTKPRTRDISFADRYSAAVINGDVLDDSAVPELAKRLWRDTEPYAQQACSSPRMIFWLGERRLSGELFDQVNQLACTQPPAIQALNNHLVTSQLVQSHDSQASPIVMDRICALTVQLPSGQLLDWHAGQGLYLITFLDEVGQLETLIDEKLQTLSYWGLDHSDGLKLLENPSITGLDRFVPVGQALDFAPVWDGFDIFQSLSRQIDLV